ncbi:hypothetical protein RhiirA4_463251 [Rhizophagus irregularis]|uniref:Uncharacterized protein n=1 Tax=Rhizophagus irregularis TaxID=588596 RepID=A0A2I1GMJ2_9GLOM|nr:hypothetical protein RhiirA4_463251 [Rhizophagus irregularis]
MITSQEKLAAYYRHLTRIKPELLTARNDSYINPHNRLQLQGWRANVDLKPILMNNVNEEDYDGDNKVWDGDEVDSDDDYCPFFYEDNLQRQKRKSYITALAIDLTKIISMRIL